MKIQPVAQYRINPQRKSLLQRFQRRREADEQTYKLRNVKPETATQMFTPVHDIDEIFASVTEPPESSISSP